MGERKYLHSLKVSPHEYVLITKRKIGALQWRNQAYTSLSKWPYWTSADIRHIDMYSWYYPLKSTHYFCCYFYQKCKIPMWAWENIRQIQIDDFWNLPSSIPLPCQVYEIQRKTDELSQIGVVGRDKGNMAHKCMWTLKLDSKFKKRALMRQLAKIKYGVQTSIISMLISRFQ